MPLKADAKLGLAMRFDVIVDELNLGSWASCAGLSIDFQPKEVDELGVCDHTQWVPGLVKYPNVTLTRAITKEDAGTVSGWLKAQAACIIGGAALSAFGGIAATALGMTGSKPAGTGTAKITLRDAYFEEVFAWTLRNVFPKKWSLGPLEAKGTNVAIETLELVHEGFL
jgi:phage tail-like protein